MYPNERSLVSRLADEPFALVGVNSDPAEDYRAAIEALKAGVGPVIVGVGPDDRERRKALRNLAVEILDVADAAEAGGVAVSAARAHRASRRPNRPAPKTRPAATRRKRKAPPRHPTRMPASRRCR